MPMTAGSGGVSMSGAAGSAGSPVGGAGGLGSSTGGSAGGNVRGGGSGGGGSGGSGGATNLGGSGGTNVGGAGNSGAFSLTSSDLAPGGMFPVTTTCAGKGTSPSLTWTPGPAGTKSYAITLLDTTLVGQGNANGYHWVIWDIPATTLALPAALPSGATLSTPVTAKQSSPANGFDNLPANAYFGPCPNAIGSTNNTDTYAFTIYALGLESLTGNLTSVKNVEAAIQAAMPLASAKLTGTSNAKPD